MSLGDRMKGAGAEGRPEVGGMVEPMAWTGKEAGPDELGGGEVT